MWSAISRIFSKSPATVEGRTAEGGEMNRRPSEMDEAAVTTRQAKPRTSIKWLLSKAFNNKVPDNLKEPFYRDHEGQEHLKPQLVGGLASAELYCLALGNIYSDPAYNSLNHWAIVQALARKGAPPRDPPDAPLTETTLIQTNPLKLNAHMAVIESLMQLYAREVVTSDRVAAAAQRWRGRDGNGDAPPSAGDPEAGLLAWVGGASAALRRRAEQEMRDGVAQNGGGGEAPKPPDIAAPRTLRDLCDGSALAALVAHYCPQEVGWAEVRTPRVPTAQDAARNVRLVADFCSRCLPANIFHLEVEDVVYLKDSMKTNLIVFLADLFNLLEINPAKCVTDRFSDDVGYPPRNAHGVVHKRNLLQTVATPIPDLRSGLDDPATPSFQVSRSTPSHQPLRKASSLHQSQSEFSEDSLRRGSDESFVVHRGRGVPTLRSVLREAEPPQRANQETREAGPPAGRPSNWEERRTGTFAGRRSRRNSVTDDSQLTIENFGGSQDNLNFIGRNPDKEVAVHVGRKISAPAFPGGDHTPSTPVRSTLQDARGSIRLGYGDDDDDDDAGREKVDAGTEKGAVLKRQMSSDDITLRRMRREREEEERRAGDGGQGKTSFADVGKGAGIQLVYMNDRGDNPSAVNGTAERKTTSFAPPPPANTTTWQQHATNAQQQQLQQHGGEAAPSGGGGGDGGGQPPVMLNSQLSDIRLKLEEKRRHIENEKRRMEVAMSKQRQKVGKQAFLQAVTKGRGNLLKSPEGDQNTDGQAEGPSTTTTTTSPEPTPQPPPPPNKPQRPFTLQEINDDATMVERKWLDEGQPYIETRRTPDLENMDLETYQQSIAQMNTSLHDIQSDMQRLAQQQNQMQTQNLLVQQQRQIQQLRQQQQQLQSLHQQQLVNQPPQYGTYRQTYAPPLQSSASAPHIPQSLYAQPRVPEQSQFFLHDHPQAAPVVPQRRTWAQQPQPPPAVDDYHPIETRTWGKQDSAPSRTGGFVLHDNTDRYRDDARYQDRYNDNKYHNGDQEHVLHHSNSFTLSQQHLQQQQHQHHGTSHSTPSASPQHRNIHRQISQLLDEGGGRRVTATPVSLQQMEVTPTRERKTSVTHAPIPAPPADDMAPQSISFIGNSSTPGREADDAGLAEGLSRLNITSGSRTYRIPSPTRPLLSKGAFGRLGSSPVPQEQPPGPTVEISSLDGDPSARKGFYISFDDEAPKRPKPPLRAKRASPKKERGYGDAADEVDELDRAEKRRQLERELEEERLFEEERRFKEEEERRRALLVQQERERLRERQREASEERQKVAAASAIIIGNELSNPDPDLLDEKERKKERIMMLSLQRRQRQEEAKARKEAEAQARREKEKEKEEEKLRRKEEQVARRAAILEQYKLKKALEEAEREGKTFDRHDLMQSLKPAPKMRSKAGSTSRPRPKTIHIDSGSVQLAEGMSTPSSRGKKGSTSNLTAYGAPSMRRDYYRGSQDSLADRSMSSTMLYKDSPDDSHGMSPCHSANQTLGRRSSYKTSREPSPAQARGRPRPPAPFRGRKSSSMMNLYGSSTDQDSLAYRLGDTDSGLGRATPPRRAPSPGMGGGRHLPSPSGPGSLPGLMTKGRRVFDDGSSDISSTPSSMMDYTGPRLYKQPATKSNRSIILNAVEYCVFPGVVNREAKRRVLEEINRSEAKHFLILFRDAGCQFRALYSYCPDTEVVTKMYGTGPKQVNDKMFDKFFKYNSGGKCFSQVHTKHLTVTIDAFTIHNSLWQGKKVNLPNKKDMALVI